MKGTSKFRMPGIVCFSIATIIILSLFFSQTGCSKKKQTYRDSEKLIEVEVGQEFEIILDSNQTTGYGWKLAKSLDEEVLELVKSKYEEPEDPVPGKGGEEVWTFKAIGKGKTEVSLEYIREWEKGKALAKTKNFKVSVNQ